jgi:threonyl-tRNA synthetase
MRVEINGDDKPLGAKIRETTLQKVPFMIIIGDKEMQESELSVAVRSREGKDLGLMKVKEFIKTHLQSI